MRLFKYFPPDRIDVLLNKKIRFTQSNCLNDPFESYPYISNIIGENHKDLFYKETILDTLEKNKDDIIYNYIPHKELNKLPEDFKDLFRNKTVKDIVEELNIKGLFDKFIDLIPSSLSQSKLTVSKIIKEKFNEIFGILSLSANGDNLMMWSHYSKNHEGFLIEFDSKNEFFNMENANGIYINKLCEVKYVSKRPEMTLYTPDDKDKLMKDIFDKVFLTKNIYWGYENEWRMIKKLDDADEIITIEGINICLYNFPTDSIKSIYMGTNISDELKKKITDVAEYMIPKPILYQSILDDKDYKINYHLIE